MSELESSTPNPSPDLAPLTVNAKEAARILGISLRLLWTYSNCREIPHVRLGRRILYPVAGLKAWLVARTLSKPRA